MDLCKRTVRRPGGGLLGDGGNRTGLIYRVRGRGQRRRRTGMMIGEIIYDTVGDDGQEMKAGDIT